MALPAYDPLTISDFLEADIKRHLRRDSTDVAIAAARFATLCRGDGVRKRPPLYEQAARTVWRVEGDGMPAPDVSVFDWGGDVAGVPALRVWFVRQVGRPPIGLGAFLADDYDVFPEHAELERRLVHVLRAPGCYLTGR